MDRCEKSRDLKLEGLEEWEYYTLRDLGMLYEFHPSATGVWEQDCSPHTEDVFKFINKDEEEEGVTLEGHTFNDLEGLVKECYHLLHNDQLFRAEEWYEARDALSDKILGGLLD